MPTEEGWVYGQAPKQPAPPCDIQGMFEAVGVPKGKLGELPHPKSWYDGAKERAAAREIEMEELFAERERLRHGWGTLMLNDLESWHERADKKLVEKGAVAGLAELLARAAHERPFDEARILDLQEKTQKAIDSFTSVTEALTNAREHLILNEENIRMKDEEDAQREMTRLEEKAAADERKRKAEKALARQAALLRGEEWDDDEDLNDVDIPPPPPPKTPPTPRTVAASVGGTANVTAVSPPSFLDSTSAGAYPAPELRGGLGRQLPPLDGYNSPTKPKVAEKIAEKSAEKK